MNKTKTIYQRRRAFTLVEMLLAMALSTILISAVAMLIGRLATDRQQLKKMETDPVWFDQLVEVIRNDLSHAEGSHIASSRLTISGRICRETGKEKRANRPALIVYQVIANETGHWLIRTHQYLDAPPASGDGERQSELVCGNLKAVVFDVFEDETEKIANDAVAGSGTSSADMELTPPPPFLNITLTQTETPLVQWRRRVQLN